MTYKLRPMSRANLAAVIGLALITTACSTPGGPMLPAGGPGPADADFSAADFAWSKAPGRNTVAGRLVYHQGAVRFSCTGSTVVLTPETPWSRRRMSVLYGATGYAALPAEEVRSRTASAPAGDAGPFVKRTTCDAASQFSFTGLPDGAWYAITLARPANDANAASVALMRRIVTRGGRVTQAPL
jgi:hypothetical protein